MQEAEPSQHRQARVLINTTYDKELLQSKEQSRSKPDRPIYLISDLNFSICPVVYETF